MFPILSTACVPDLLTQSVPSTRCRFSELLNTAVCIYAARYAFKLFETVEPPWDANHANSTSTTHNNLVSIALRINVTRHSSASISQRHSYTDTSDTSACSDTDAPSIATARWSL